MKRLFLPLSLLSLCSLALNGQSTLAEIAELQGAVFPKDVRRAIQYADEQGVRVQFGLMSDTYELITAQEDVFLKYNRQISLKETLGYYRGSHRDFFDFEYTLLPFATSVNHHHPDKVDFLAIVLSDNKAFNGRILYSNIDYSLAYPALVAPSFGSLFQDFSAGIDAAVKAGETTAKFKLKDDFVSHSFDYPFDARHETMRDSALQIIPESNQLQGIQSQIAVENLSNDGGQRVRMELILRQAEQTIRKRYYIADLKRFRQEDNIHRYIVASEYRRMYSKYLWCADKFIGELDANDIAYEDLLDSVSMSTTYRQAVYTQLEKRPATADKKGTLRYDGKTFGFTLGADKTRVEDADEDINYQTLVDGLKPRWVNGLSDGLETKIIGLHRTASLYDVLAEVVNDPTDSSNNGCVLYVTAFAPHASAEHSDVKSQKVYSSVKDLLLANTFETDLDGQLVFAEMSVSGVTYRVAPATSVGRKRFLPYLSVLIDEYPNQHLITLDYQFEYDRYQRIIKLPLSVAMSQAELVASVVELLWVLSENDPVLARLTSTQDLEQTVGLGLR